MTSKIFRVALSFLILVGIFLAISNFLPELEAGGHFGTTTELSGPEDLEYYLTIYTPEEMGSRWLGEGQTYCLDDDFNCVIVN